MITASVHEFLLSFAELGDGEIPRLWDRPPQSDPTLRFAIIRPGGWKMSRPAKVKHLHVVLGKQELVGKETGVEATT
jgi:hypothetical protein